MAQITLKGNPINTGGKLPEPGTFAPEFKLTGNDLQDNTLEDFTGKRIVLNIFPSLDTPVCAMSVRRFNAEAANFINTAVLCISRDLPFAQARFCGAEGIKNVVTLSEFRDTDFGKDYGLEIVDSPMAGLLARAVIILDEKGRIIYTELVPEIAQEPNYDAALKVLV
jgi:thiol peroxidase